jgi:small subunit ribosomal protein S3
MGRKVHPYGFRLKVIRDWQGRWFSKRGTPYVETLMEDLKLRRMIEKQSGRAGISRVDIERFPNQLIVTIHTAKPGIIIGRKGAAVKTLREDLERMTKKKVKLEVEEITKPDLDAKLVAENIAGQLERRITHGRAMKRAIQQAMRAGAQGVKITVAGRLGGSEMSRRETILEGRVPRNTLRADLEFARAEAHTTYGRIGVKVWVYNGEVLPEASPSDSLPTPSTST